MTFVVKHVIDPIFGEITAGEEDFAVGGCESEGVGSEIYECIVGMYRLYHLRLSVRQHKLDLPGVGKSEVFESLKAHHRFRDD